MKKIFGVLLAILMLVSLATAAIPSEQWNKTYGGINDDHAYAGQQTSDGGYIIIGDTYSYSVGGSDIWLIKTDKNGRKKWSKTFGGDLDDRACCIEQTSDGGYVFGGITNFSYDPSKGDATLIKTDNNGNEKWRKIFKLADDTAPNYNSNQIFSVQQTLDGGYILGVVQTLYPWNIYSIIKTNNNGNQIWNTEITYHVRSERIDSIMKAYDGGYVLLSDSSSGDTTLHKLDTNGKWMWNKTISGGKFGQYGQQTSDGGYIIVGYSDGYIWLAKTDKNGNKLWDRILEIGNARYVEQTTDGGYVLTGYDYNNGTSVIKTNFNGNKIWNITISRTCFDCIKSVQQTSDGYVLIGSKNSYEKGFDVWLIKLYMPTWHSR